MGITTPDDRERVAETLRVQAAHTMPYGVINTLKGAVEVDGTWRDVWRRLADLVDPTCEVVSEACEDATGGYAIHRYRLSCGHMVASLSTDPPAFCERCGARILPR